MVKRPYKRKKILIDRFQYQLLLINLIYFFTILMIFSAALFGPLILRLENHTPASPELEAVAIQFLSLHARVWPALFIAFLLFSIHSVYVSHKIAGPLTRFRNTFKAIATGNLSGRVTIRKYDYLGSEADVLNEMITGLQAKIKGIDAQYREARTAFGKLRGGIEARAGNDLPQTIEALGLQMEKLRECIDQFRLPDLVPVAGGSPHPLPRHPASMIQRASSAREWFQDAVPFGDRGRKGHGRGFTIIELLAIIAILGTLAGLALPTYFRALDRARVTKAIVDIRSLSNEITAFQLYNGSPPESLDAIGRATFKDPYGNPYEYLNFSASQGQGGGQGQGQSGQGQGQGQGGGGLGGLTGQVRKDRFLVPINSDYDLYSKGRDGQSVPPLTAQASWDDIIRANDGGFIGLASEY
jgi:general secretion pathway protein G